MRTPRVAAWVYRTLGNVYQNLGSFSKVLEHHKEHLTMAKEVGDRAGEGAAYANLGIAYQSHGDYAKAIEYHTQDLAIAKEVGGSISKKSVRWSRSAPSRLTT